MFDELRSQEVATRFTNHPDNFRDAVCVIHTLAKADRLDPLVQGRRLAVALASMAVPGLRGVVLDEVTSPVPCSALPFYRDSSW